MLTLVSEKIKKIAKKARSDFFFFCKNILGYSKMAHPVHTELCNFAAPKMRKRLILMPRGSFKSSVVTVGLTLFRLVHNPNLRILVAGATQKNAKKFVKEIKGHLDENNKFKALFGDWHSKDNTWRDDEFLINRRTLVKKESSVMASSLERQTITGQHYDMIILDDPVDKTNINTPEQIQKTIDYYKMLLSILEPDGEIIIIGTRYSAMDLYGYLSDAESPEKGTIETFVREAEDNAGNLLLPEVLTRYFLEEQKRTQGEFLYNTQYLNKVTNPETAFFKESEIMYYEELPKNLIYFITFDPATSKLASADYSAFIVNGVDEHHNYYIAEAIQARLTPNEVVDQVFELVRVYQPQLVAMEKFIIEQMLKVAMVNEMGKRNIVFPIRELENDTRISKVNRIRGLQPKFNNKQIFLHKSQKALIHQIIYYPLGVKNDDLLDALKSQLSVTYPASVAHEKKVTKYDNIPPADARRWAKDMKSLRTVRRKQW